MARARAPVGHSFFFWNDKRCLYEYYTSTLLVPPAGTVVQWYSDVTVVQ